MMLVATIAMIQALLIFIVLICNKETMKSTFLTFLSIAIAFYMIGNYIEIANESLEVASVGLMIRFIGIPFIPTLWYFSVREFCGLKFKKKSTIMFFLIVPSIIVYLAFTWEQNHLLFMNAEYINDNNNGNLKIIPGPLFGLRLLYQYSINALGLYTLIKSFRNGTKRFRKQALLFLASTLIPLFNVTTYIVKIGSYNVDITPYGLLITMALFTVALYRFGVLNMSYVVKEKAVDNLQEGLLLFDQNGIYMESNISARKIFPQINNLKLGTGVDEIEGLPFGSSLFENHHDKTERIQEFTKDDNGVVKTYGVSISHVRLDKKIIGHSVILNNITLLKNILSSLKEKSVTDPLTGIYNRAYLFEAGNHEFAKSKINKEIYSIVMTDIDYFKKVNDNYGHVFGDYVLKAVASICSSNLRKSDIAARYGGEEFCIILLGNSIENARIKAELLREKISEYTFESEGTSTNITASFGISAFQPEDEDFIDAIKRADENLYKAKQDGRNRVCC